MAYVSIDERYLIRVEIEDNQVEIIQREYQKKDKDTKKPTGEIGMLYSQMGYIYLGKQVIECKLGMQKDQPPYPAGMYLLHPATLKVDGFGGLDFGFDTILIPISEAKAK
ncbi:heavy metal transporter [Salmonella enterica subsp. enterica serovar Panama]|uniref:Single-stranded DNA-binding protein n=1 Tax=Salmonella enterica subsp. enterica serovar Panama TaxID=29472 RepID=A0A619AF13_SALET|nr:heavy metal transporter [Salmonella enterica subsp. enterica serovar Panama]ECX3494247.1 heavy metal transporter [Salmonella enterica subsp. enterica serovar Panama]ECX6033864.1 heavy metal transporter [Salmonella enterica subsp. enterica serovar Panama]EGU5379582.1 heavy metal transporter [Salmonella enterica]EGX1719563.1 heavy metal transporter [Salmonella enterica subsp. enterica serovar Panama]